MRILFLFGLLLLVFEPAFSQSSYSLGIRNGIGLTVPSVNSTIELDGTIYKLRKYPFFNFGVSAQYLLGDMMGIETGLILDCINFSVKGRDADIHSKLRLYSDLEFMKYQIPVQVIYKTGHPSDPFKHFKITAGTILEWLNPYMAKDAKTFFVTNFVAGLRFGGRQGKAGRLELSVEYLNSLRRYFYITNRFNKKAVLTSQNSSLSLNLLYFFVNRKIR